MELPWCLHDWPIRNLITKTCRATASPGRFQRDEFPFDSNLIPFFGLGGSTIVNRLVGNILRKIMNNLWRREFTFTVHPIKNNHFMCPAVSCWLSLRLGYSVWLEGNQGECHVGHPLWHMGQSPAQTSGTHTWHTLVLKHSMWNLGVTFTLKGFLVAMLVSLPEVCFCSSCPGPSEKKNCQSSSLKHRLLFHDTVFGKFYVRREWFTMIYLSCGDRMRSESFGDSKVVTHKVGRITSYNWPSIEAITPFNRTSRDPPCMMGTRYRRHVERYYTDN